MADTLCGNSSDKEGVVKVTQLKAGSLHYLEPPTHLPSLTVHSIHIFPSWFKWETQSSWDTKALPHLPAGAALGFWRLIAPLSITSSCADGALRPRWSGHRKEASVPENLLSWGQNNQDKTKHSSSREKVKCSSDTYWKEKERHFYIHLL